jgi:hypothetical protein
MFLDYTKTLSNIRILELGTKRSNPDISTLHHCWFSNYSVYHGTDIELGIDVDFVADVHSLSNVIGEESYDVIISCSSFEHFKYPHLAAFEISKSLKIGGCVFIQTHSCFPLHAYPYDYFRFSTEALCGCFGTKNGISIKSSDYDFPAQIVSERIPTMQGISFLNVNMFGIKEQTTPPNYIYELDTNL